MNPLIKVDLSQGSTIALKRVYISMYALINLNVCHIKVKTRTSSKKLRSKRVHRKTKKSLFYYRVFKVLIIQNHSSAFNKGLVNQKQAVNYLLQYYENSYIQKLIFVKDFCRYLNISFVILVCCFFIIIFFLVFSFKLSCMCVFFCF